MKILWDNKTGQRTDLWVLLMLSGPWSVLFIVAVGVLAYAYMTQP